MSAAGLVDEDRVDIAFRPWRAEPGLEPTKSSNSWGNRELGEQRAFREWAPTRPHLRFTEFQKEGPWRNSFIVNVRP